MELIKGVCGMCSTSSLVLNSENSQNYCNLIYSHFEEELNIPSESKSNFNLCPTCVYHITLIRSKKNVLASGNIDGVEDIDKCALCKEIEENFKFSDTSFLDKCKSWVPVKDAVTLCASCFYIIDIDNDLKENLQKVISMGNQKNTPKLRTILRRRKSSYGVEKSSPIDTEETNSKSSPNSICSLDSTPVRNKRRRSKNLEEVLNKEELKNSKSNKRKRQNIEQPQNEIGDLNLSSLSHFSPLCRTDFNINKKYKSDKKLYNCIPFVKIQSLEQTNAPKDEGNYVCSVVAQRPMIRVTRTPPIKIKAIKEISPHKKNDQNKKLNKSIGKIPNQKLVVKVERMKIEIPSGEEAPKEECTPKKKKRVHFNDTPTIIITDDNYYDDCRTRSSNRKSSEAETVEMDDNEDGVELVVKEEDKLAEEEKEDMLEEEEEEDKLEEEEEDKLGEEGDKLEEKKEEDKLEEQKEENIPEQEEEEEKSDSDELTLALEDSDDEPKETQCTEENTREKENEEDENQGSQDAKSKDAQENEEEQSPSSENGNKETEELKECEENSDNEEKRKNLNDCVMKGCDEDSDDNTIVDGLTEDEKDTEMEEFTNNSENNEVLDKKTEETNEPEKDSSNDGEDTTENTEEMRKHSEETEEDENEEKYNLQEDSTDKSIDISRLNDVQTEEKGKSNIKTIDPEEKEESNNETTEPEEKEESNNKTTEPEEKEESNNKTIEPEEKEEPNKKTVEDTLSNETKSHEEESKEKSVEETDEKIDTFEEETNIETVEEEDKDTENGEDIDTEKDSLDGFEVIDQEDGDSPAETKKVSSENNEEGTCEMDEIESLVKKYCDKKKDVNRPTETIDEEKNLDNGAQNSHDKDDLQEEKENSEEVDDSQENINSEEEKDESQEKKNSEEEDSQEKKENNCNKQNSGQENEDFGLLIDEVQKCLTTKESLNKTEEGEDILSQNLMPTASELDEILNSSFDVNSTETANSSDADSVNGNKGLKRKKSEEEPVSDNKRTKIDISEA